MKGDPLTLQASDVLWLLALPIYLILGTALHEGAHMVVALLAGARVLAVSIIPNSHEWGSVQVDPRGLQLPSMLFVLLAPYLLYFCIYLVSVATLSHFVFRRRWVLISLFSLGIAAPIVDCINSYHGVASQRSDTGQLLRVGFHVHTLFPVLIACYIVRLFLLRNARRRLFCTQATP